LDLARQGLPAPISVRSLPHCTVGTRAFSWQDFRRWRQRGTNGPAWTTGYGFALTFDAPVCGPLALGYGTHFGLGTFVPSTTASGID
jgi:CRISPR-associated protein Csb2